MEADSLLHLVKVYLLRDPDESHGISLALTRSSSNKDNSIFYAIKPRFSLFPCSQPFSKIPGNVLSDSNGNWYF